MNRACTVCLLFCLAALSFAGCGRGAQATAAQYLPADIQTVTITYDSGGSRMLLEAGDEDLRALRDWMVALKLGGRAEFAGGQSPGQNEEGGEIYWFAFGEGEPLSYRCFGPEACYFVVDGEWYPVANPTDPPVGDAAG